MALEPLGQMVESIRDSVARGFPVPTYDYIDNTYTGTNLTTTTYKRGGSGGTVVGVVTMTYDGNNNLLTATFVG